MRNKPFFYKNEKPCPLNVHNWGENKCKDCGIERCSRVITRRHLANTTRTKSTGKKYYNYLTRRCKNVAVDGTHLCYYHNKEDAEAALGLDMR